MRSIGQENAITAQNANRGGSNGDACVVKCPSSALCVLTNGNK